jgi:cold shock CspA family protein
MKLIGKGRGTVIKWDVEKKFGFASIQKVEKGGEFIKEDVIVSQKQDAFIYHNEIVMEGFRKLIPGQIVEFDIYRTNKGYSAKEVKVVGDAFDNEGEINGNK